MTMPDERARSLVWAGGFLLELIHDTRIPEDLRLKATRIARHFPCIDDVALAAGGLDRGCLQIAVPDKSALTAWTNDLTHGPLSWSNRIR